MSVGAPNPVELKIPARDGLELAATLLHPPEAARGLVVVNSATAVPRRFYRHFAAALAGAGYAVLTYDYRGIGDSRPASLRGFDATVRDWGLLDMAGVLDWAIDELSPERMLFVGHSIGGQLAGLLDRPEAIDGLATMSAQSGYWALQGGEQKALVALHVYFTLPLLAKTLGYMPWSWVGGGEDLPSGVALEWSRWCRSPGYLLDDSSLPLERFNRFTAPVLAYSFGDDKWGTSKSVDAMMGAYPRMERRHVEPAAAGLEDIGHFGYFRPGAASLWCELIEWFDGMESRQD